MRELSGVGLRGEADFFRRNNNRSLNRQKRIRSIRIQGIHMVAILVVLTMGALLAYRAGHFMLTWERLNVSSFQLVNPPHFERDHVRSLVREYRGNILTLDFQSLRKRLLKIREVRSVSLTRRLPSTVVVNFELRVPVFQYERSGGYRIMDRDGVVLDQGREPCDHLITLKGLREADLPRLKPYLPELEKIRGNVRYVGLDSLRRVVVKWKGLPEIVYPPARNFDRRLQDYLHWKRKLGLTRPIRYVDLRFENRYYFAYRKEA